MMMASFVTPTPPPRSAMNGGCGRDGMDETAASGVAWRMGWRDGCGGVEMGVWVY